MTADRYNDLSVHRAFAQVYRQHLRYLRDLKGESGKIVDVGSRPATADIVKFADVSNGPLFTVSAEMEERGAAERKLNFIVLAGIADDLSVQLPVVLRDLPGGSLLVVIERDARGVPGERAAERRELNIADFISNGLTVHVYDSFDPCSEERYEVYASIKSTAESDEEKRCANREYVERIAAVNAQNEIDSRCKYSQEYQSYKLEHPDASYASFAVTKEAVAVSASARHATLGNNISDASRRQGDSICLRYRRILGVKRTERVIEYGCGSLRVGEGFIEYLEDGRFFGLDVVPGFYEIGRERVIRRLGGGKGHRFHVIDEQGLREAEEFQADHVYASNVIFHIHPDDIVASLSNIARLCAKPGCRLIFDAKITRDGEPGRCAQKDGKGGWAWPLEFYRAALFPLNLIAVHSRSSYDWYPGVDVAYLEFQMPYSK